MGLVGLAPIFVSGQGAVASGPALAIGLGGVLLGFRAFHKLTAGVWSLAGAAIAWRQTAPVFLAATRQKPLAVASASTTGSAALVLDATDLRFTHAGRNEPVLRGCTLSLTAGERIILQGPSGCGKSTLASILAGLRTPQSGLLLADGLDRHTLGLDRWRRRVVLVPQFHENHVALATVAFNLLMGAEWPARREDFARADRVLRELGLGDTLDRMPSGLLQTIVDLQQFGQLWRIGVKTAAAYQSLDRPQNGDQRTILIARTKIDRFRTRLDLALYPEPRWTCHRGTLGIDWLRVRVHRAAS
jgi:ATP-binding cassette, subfamily B, bacterial